MSILGDVGKGLGWLSKIIGGSKVIVLIGAVSFCMGCYFAISAMAGNGQYAWAASGLIPGGILLLAWSIPDMWRERSSIVQKKQVVISLLLDTRRAYVRLLIDLNDKLVWSKCFSDMKPPEDVEIVGDNLEQIESSVREVFKVPQSEQEGELDVLPTYHP